jgi:arsenite oxidase small subunit
MMDRRRFIKLCGTAIALNSIYTYDMAKADPQSFTRARLIESTGEPVKAAKLITGVNYLFHYPYVGTPAFLIKLPKPTATDVELKTAVGDMYTWPGGIGANHSVVAFSAICPHQLSAALRQRSFLSYIPNKSPVAGRDNVIVCCAHHSVYDPEQGGNVISGPAPQPLTAILLEHDQNDDGLIATGTLGGTLFNEFFKAYKRELIKEFGRGEAHQMVTNTAELVPLSKYTAKVFNC